ncbi:hypothetical protein MMC34_005183 [Xylographa carneopallida]|nr:hypothetical protein [Xylographa carneopallida]
MTTKQGPARTNILEMERKRLADPEMPPDTNATPDVQTTMSYLEEGDVIEIETDEDAQSFHLDNHLYVVMETSSHIIKKEEARKSPITTVAVIT